MWWQDIQELMVQCESVWDEANRDHAYRESTDDDPNRTNYNKGPNSNSNNIEKVNHRGHNDNSNGNANNNPQPGGVPGHQSTKDEAIDNNNNDYSNVEDNQQPHVVSITENSIHNNQDKDKVRKLSDNVVVMDFTQAVSADHTVKVELSCKSIDVEAEKKDRQSIGFLGEQVLFETLKKEFSEHENVTVTWLNEKGESGKPFDILVSVKDKSMQETIWWKIEVKSTGDKDKTLFEISGPELAEAQHFPTQYHIYLVYFTSEGTKIFRITNVWEHLRQHKLGLYLDTGSQ